MAKRKQKTTSNNSETDYEIIQKAQSIIAEKGLTDVFFAEENTYSTSGIKPHLKEILRAEIDGITSSPDKRELLAQLLEERFEKPEEEWKIGVYQLINYVERLPENKQIQEFINKVEVTRNYAPTDMKSYILMHIPECAALNQELFKIHEEKLDKFFALNAGESDHPDLDPLSLKAGFLPELLLHMLGFDPAKGGSFSTHLHWAMEGYLSKAKRIVSDQRTHLQQADERGYDGVVLDNIANNGALTSLEALEEQQTIAAAMQAIEAVLDDRQRTIFHMRFQEGMTLEEIGNELKITKQRVGQIETIIRNKIAAALEPFGISPKMISNDQRLSPKDKRDKSYLTDAFIKDLYAVPPDTQDLVHTLIDNALEALALQNDGLNLISRFVIAGLLSGHSDREIRKHINQSHASNGDCSHSTVYNKRIDLEGDLAKAQFVAKNRKLIDQIMENSETGYEFRSSINRMQRKEAGEEKKPESPAFKRARAIGRNISHLAEAAPPASHAERQAERTSVNTSEISYG